MPIHQQCHEFLIITLYCVGRQSTQPLSLSFLLVVNRTWASCMKYAVLQIWIKVIYVVKYKYVLNYGKEIAVGELSV